MSTREIPIDENGLYAIVDECDYELVMRFNTWCRVRSSTIRENYYARCHHTVNGQRMAVWLHRVVLLATGLKPPSKYHTIADHIDRDGLNCRRSNLRWNTKSGNAKNCDYAERGGVSIGQHEIFVSAGCHPNLEPHEYKTLRAADPRAFVRANTPAEVIKNARSYDLVGGHVVDHASVEAPF